MNNNIKKDLMLCFTPLQAFTLGRIIEEENLIRKNIDFLFFSSNRTPLIDHAFSELQAHGGDSHRFSRKAKLWEVIKLKIFLTGKYYRDIYLANANSTLANYVLSFCHFDHIRTFDDGVINVNSSCFYIEKYQDDNTTSIAIAKWLFKKKYTARSIVEKAEKHYTILKHNDNINVKCDLTYINLFSKRERDTLHHETPNKKEECNIFIGSKFNEIIKGDNESSLLKEMVIFKFKNDINFLISRLEQCIYLPHPRERDKDFLKEYRLEVNEISEKVIFNLMEKYHKINIYGFSSTCQFNLIGNNNINCIVLDSHFLRDDIKLSSHYLIKDGATMINIDRPWTEPLVNRTTRSKMRN
ncbi:glycosyltransferase family 52 [Pectobacterium cacticida]|uniref:glycosyltransferase family 52 n=2 Tax=Pectobacterium cacticida TaxID=69221 RepID=UPI002FF32B8A